MKTAVLLFLISCSGAALLGAASATENIGADWRPQERRRLTIANATASAFLDAQYAPNRIRDGDRHTKWVSPTKPSLAAPQWITVELAGGLQEINAVAVFGERIGNDGILDAEIQVETKGDFRPVASVTNANSAAWLVTFEAVRTAKVRLLVTRSSGPTDHTDVYELEVYSRPLSDPEQKALLTQQLKALRAKTGDIEEPLRRQRQDLFRVLNRTLEKCRATTEELEHDLARWPGMSPQEKNLASEKAETMLMTIQQVQQRIQQAAATGRDTTNRVWMALEEVRRNWLQMFKGPPADAVEVELGTERARLANNRLVVVAEPASSTWSAYWARGTEVALRRMGFRAEANGHSVTEGKPEFTVRAFEDRLGKGQELLQTWRAQGIQVQRELRVYDGLGVITIGGRIRNEGQADVKLGTTGLVELEEDGAWWGGQAVEEPAAVYIAGHSLLRSSPFEMTFGGESRERTYQSSGVLSLVSREPNASLTIGYVRADEAAPDLSARFRTDAGGTGLSARSRFLGRVLGPSETVELNRVCIAGDNDSFRALEAYGDAVTRFSPRPVHNGPTSLWCSWYAHRMGMTEEKVLANAAVAARQFQPLGLEIMQLDHGWQRGDVTGDWVPNERFPHGLRWLSDQLRERYNLRLGVWISPTDVAETSETFKKHPEWMLKGDDGKPRVNWRWYWKPNPNCYEVDATHPGAYQYIVDSFKQLTDWGVSYYKIDFIAASGGEHFIQIDPKSTRGWSVLRRAMEAVRAGAGENAWIRYCQTPPVASAGLANSAYGGDDTLDAGIPGRFDVLRDNAHALAAGYWLNDRPYHREVCDMSVRMQGSVEEARVRGAIMTLANCSISWSDEFCYLPPSRIRLMQQCMPPGNPPMRPLDLFERDVPSIWHIKVQHPAENWDVVGLFNFTGKAEPRAVTFKELGLDPQNRYAVFEFWTEQFLGIQKDGIEVSLPAESSRIVSIRRLADVPQLIGTDMHLLQGYHELKEISWDASTGNLAGVFARMPGTSGKAFYYVPQGFYPKFEFPLSPASARLTHVEGNVWMQEIEFTEKDFRWQIPFELPRKPQAKEPTATN